MSDGAIQLGPGQWTSEPQEAQAAASAAEAPQPSGSHSEAQADDTAVYSAPSAITDLP